MIKIRKLNGLGDNKFTIIDEVGKIYCELFKYMTTGRQEATIFIHDNSVHEILDNEKYSYLKSRLTDSVFFKTEAEAIKCLKFIDAVLFGERK